MVADRWAAVSSAVRNRYRQVVGNDGPADEDVRQALVTIGDAVKAVVVSINGALQEPSTREHLKKVTSSIASAVGATLADLGDELRSSKRDEEE